MKIETYLPDEELKARVESLLIVRSDEDIVRTLPPHNAPVLVFRLQGTIAQQLPDGERIIPRMALTGLNRAARVMHYHGGAVILLVRFRAGGTAGLLESPMDELAGTSQGLECLIDPRLALELEDRLHEGADGPGRIAVLQDFLKSRLADQPLDPLIGETIRRISHSRGNVRIGDLVRSLATNLDTLEKRFRHQVGATPKTFSRIVRFQSFLNSYSAQRDLTEAALQAGYYDQAHLVKESQALTGLSPTAFLLQSGRW